ncbi:MAG: DNA repair protein RadC [Brumimicrobium sp.]|nr:DNA repair protein RadC [Brumimicrobium sp.]MCO5268934.1 DNA repair protein RadC [Brumimicrobium sp.]
MYKNTTSIKQWAEDDRPREKMMLKGKANLSNSELLAIVIGSGTKKKSAVQVASEILTTCDNNLYLLGKLTLADLMKFNGIGEAKAISILAVLELGRRRSNEDTPKNPIMNTAKDIYNYVKSDFLDLQHEEFRVLGLSRSNKVLGNILISKGGRSGTIADGKLIFKELLDIKASSCILLHNHPSGKLEASVQDVSVTKRIAEFGKMIDLPVLDHVIITDNGYYSLLENGRF